MSRFLAAAAALLAALAGGPALAQSGWPANVVPLTAGSPLSGFNRLWVSVTVCEPREGHAGLPRCATIDRVMVDTGSVGLRLQAHAVPGFLALPAVRDAQGRPVAECLRFLNSAAWGGVHRADVHLGGMVAADIPIQVVGTDLPRAESCPGGGHPTSNGTLGLGWHPTDCGDGPCVQSRTHPGYLVCTDRDCVAMEDGVPPALRVANPVQRFGLHDDGVVFDLPMPARRGVAEVQGTLTFGINTAANNQMRGARILRLDRTGHFTTRFDGAEFRRSYIDSGTEFISIPGSPLPRCWSGGVALCLEPARRLTAVMEGEDGTGMTMPFLVGRFPNGERGVFASAAMAAKPESESFVWGAPFFLGRRVFLGYRDKPVPGVAGTGAFYAVEGTGR